MAEIDDLGDGIFVRLLQWISWILVVTFSIPAALLIVYQLLALYIPYALARITGNDSYRFPDYFYKVWGEDMTDLTLEHWGYLASCIFVTVFAWSWVIPQTPWSRHAVDERKKND